MCALFRRSQSPLPSAREFDLPAGPSEITDQHDLIDVDALLSDYSVEDLAQSAEDYLSRLPDWESALAKPFYSTSEAPELLASFGALLAGLDLVHDMDVLDFGVGSGWTSWMLSQLGCRVIASDISATAIRITEERYRRSPITGAVTAPRFLHFDGHRLSLDDSSVDRIVSNDSFHHVPNFGEVLNEFGRVLRPGGLCVMAEPGPYHSIQPQSQVEMRNFRVVERNIVLDELVPLARAAGFDSIDVGLYVGSPHFVPAETFDTALTPPSRLGADLVSSYLSNRRLLRLHKSGSSAIDSRWRGALAGVMDVTRHGPDMLVRVTNTGLASWLQTPGTIGQVNLGGHLLDAAGTMVDYDFLRVSLRDGGVVEPGETVEISAEIPTPSGPGQYRLVLDLVSEGVCWFADNGGTTASIDI